MRKPKAFSTGLFIRGKELGSGFRVNRRGAKIDYGKLDGMRHLFLCLALTVLCLGANDLNLLPASHLIDSKVVNEHLFAPTLGPGGVAANYHDAKGSYRLLLARLPTNDKAAFLLLDIKKLMTQSRYLAHMGGFAGTKDGQPFYIFAKGPFVAAIAGKAEAEADALARIFAGRLPLR